MKKKNQILLLIGGGIAFLYIIKELGKKKANKKPAKKKTLSGGGGYSGGRSVRNRYIVTDNQGRDKIKMEKQVQNPIKVTRKRQPVEKRDVSIKQPVGRIATKKKIVTSDKENKFDEIRQLQKFD